MSVRLCQNNNNQAHLCDLSYIAAQHIIHLQKEDEISYHLKMPIAKKNFISHISIANPTYSHLTISIEPHQSFVLCFVFP